MKKSSLLPVVQYAAILLVIFTPGSLTLSSEDFDGYYNNGSEDEIFNSEPADAGRQITSIVVKCPEPFQPNITLMPGKTMCCKPNVEQTYSNCCPADNDQILIPGREPAFDPSFGPFCCDPSTGHCCSINLDKSPAQYPKPDPKTGKCCMETNCCFRPLVPVGGSCCFPQNNDPMNCCPTNHILKWPIPSCCVLSNLSIPQEDRLEEGFCCPLPYIIRFQSSFINLVKREYHFKCLSPAVSDCELPSLPNYRSCIPPTGLRTQNYEKDNPQYDQVFTEFTNADPEATLVFDQPKCRRQEVTREVYGNPYGPNADEHSVAVNWFVTSPFIPRVQTLNETITDFMTWPQAIIPFIFPIAVSLLGFSFMVPAVFLGGICWALLYNLRHLGHKKVRMKIRSWLIRHELHRRNFQNQSIPPEELRKIRQRDRHQLPKIFQDSDLSCDDEPEELRRETVSYKVGTYWTQEEIDRLGFDPDHIPLEWIYGDLIGKPEAVQPEVRSFNVRRQQKSQVGEDEGGGSLDTEEWHDFIQNRPGHLVIKDAQTQLNKIRERQRKSRASRSLLRSTTTSELTKAKRKKRKVRRPYKRKK